LLEAKLKTNNPIYIGDSAVDELLKYVEANGLNQFTLVSDANTYAALGRQVEAALQGKAYNLTTIVLDGEEVIAGGDYLLQVLANAPVADHTFIAVGSGTITDITRFISYRTKNTFISMPTATSVDGFTSIGAPLVLDGVKQTLISQAPLAVFADLPTLQNAPKRLIASGFGDMVGKYTSLADWQLGRMLWDEPYDEDIAKRARTGLDTCINYANEIGKADADGIRYLMDGLVESGLCMLEFGSSRPASGAEHHCSHYWEMMLLNEGRPALLHGQKVGFATTLIIGQYNKLRSLSRQDVMDRLEAATLPDRAEEEAIIREAYGDAAEQVIRDQSAFLDMTPEKFDATKRKIAEHWDDILAIAESLPSVEEVTAALDKVGGPTTAEELGVTDDEVQRALRYGHFLRNRFTVMKLSRILDISLLPHEV
jgi:glycerol-1-phosphate dehydrogenase [NAD(P)+]